MQLHIYASVYIYTFTHRPTFVTAVFDVSTMDHKSLNSSDEQDLNLVTDWPICNPIYIAPYLRDISIRERGQRWGWGGGAEEQRVRGVT